MKKYKVPFHGFCYVLADSAQEALDQAEDDGPNVTYQETEFEDATEVGEFEIEL